MAKNRYINTKMWRDEYFTNLDPSEKLLFMYALTSPDTNIAGVYEIPLKIMATDTGLERDTVRRILARFERDGKIKYKNGWIAIKNFHKHQLDNPKVKRGIELGMEAAPREMIEYVYSIDSLSHLNSNSNLNSNPKSNSKRGRFTPPSLSEVQVYIKSKGYNIDAEQFCAFYESKGWMVGKNKMKSWQACLVTWSKRDKLQMNTGKPRSTKYKDAGY